MRPIQYHTGLINIPNASVRAQGTIDISKEDYQN